MQKDTMNISTKFFAVEAGDTVYGIYEVPEGTDVIDHFSADVGIDTSHCADALGKSVEEYRTAFRVREIERIYQVETGAESIEELFLSQSDADKACASFEGDEGETWSVKTIEGKTLGRAIGEMGSRSYDHLVRCIRTGASW